METWYLIVAVIIAALISGSLYFFLKRGYRSVAIALLTPILGLMIYILPNRDEFGYWGMFFSFGVCACLVGSPFGVFVASLLKKP